VFTIFGVEVNKGKQGYKSPKTTSEMKKTLEQIEFATLIDELIAKGQRVEIEKVESLDGRKGFRVSHVIRHAGSKRGEVEDSPLEAVRSIVDRLREEAGEPTLAESANASQLADEQHAASPLVEIGTGAACSCGSRKPLIMERRIKLEVPWQTGKPELDRVFGLMGIEGIPGGGEIGTCPDCGKSYRFGA